MGKQLVIVGTGHAHMTVLKHLNDFVSAGHSITAVSSSRYHYYSGMGPGMLSGIYQPDDIRFDMRKMVQTRGGTFVEDDVTRIDPVERKLFLGQGNPISYDLVSFNTGSYVPLEKGLACNGHVIPVKPIENLLTARANIIDALKTKNLNITVAGGGPTGVEVSGNLSRLVKEASGQARARSMGWRMSGAAIWASTDPSRSSSRAWAVEPGCTSTPILSSDRSKRRRASPNMRL